MNRIARLFLVINAAIGATANAVPIDRGNGMVYDSTLDITWLSDASMAAGTSYDDGLASDDGLMQWQSALAWVDSLSFGGFDDWRLPWVDVNLDGEVVDCSVVSEESCRDNELGYMFYHILGGTLGQDFTRDQGLFRNIQPRHWSANAHDADFLWDFGFDGSAQALVRDGTISGAWAVRSGDTVAPQRALVVSGPGTFVCSGLSLVLVGWFRFWRLSRMRDQRP